MRRTITRTPRQRLRRPTRPLRLLAPLLLASAILTILAACAPHTGGSTIAFLRDGSLWTIQPDGSVSQRIAGPAVAGFAWSPDHHQMVFRYGAQSVAAAQSLTPTSPESAPNAPGDLAIISINGGYGLQLTPTAANVPRSDAWWDANGNRLVYSEGVSDQSPTGFYIDSQADQPVGIARKPLLDAAGIPVLSPDGMRAAVIDPAGNLRVSAPASVGAVVARGALLTLPTTNRPARLLWQPGHDALLYETAAANGVTLRLLSLSGDHSNRALGAVPALLDLAFSPDGSRLLLRSPTNFTLLSLANPAAPLGSWSESDPLALPWWSPDGQRLLIQDSAGLRLIDLHNGSQRDLLRLANAQPQPTTASSHPVWRPTSDSPWSADGSQIVFVASAGDQWNNAAIPAPAKSATGLYVATIQGDSAGSPRLIASGSIRAPSWNYLDPSTTFLLTA